MPVLRKGLGQHHLRHPHLCAPAIRFLRPGGQTVVEIGPGGGILTRELIAAGADVTAWEIDPAWAFALRRSLAPDDCRLVVGDALDIPWARLGGGTLAAGNLPYGVATAIIEALLVEALAVRRAAFLVQQEVATRICSVPGVRSYGLLSVMVQVFARAEILARVDPGSFRPAPKVAGAFVGLTRREAPLVEGSPAAFRRTLAAAFSHRRKTLGNALASAWGRAEARRRIAAAGLDASARAETLDVASFVRLHLAD